MKQQKSRKAELGPNATGGEKSHAETAESAEFKTTELGPIPVDWEVKTVKDIAEIGRGRVISQVEIEKSIAKLYPVYSSQTSNDGEMGRLDSYDFDGEYVTWTTDGVNAGRVFYRNGKFNCTNVCGVLKIINESPQYAAIALNMRTCDYVATNLANPKLMNCVMKEIKLPLPPLAEQRRIAGALSDVDELISALGKLIEKKRNIKTGAMQELLGMRNSECGMRNVPRRRLPGFSGEWVEKRLGECGDFIGGGTPSTAIQSYWNGVIDWYTPAEIGVTKYVNKSNRRISLEGLKNSAARLLPVGTILLTTRATIGLRAILQHEAATNQGFQSLVVAEGFDSEFMYYLLLTAVDEMVGRASGSTFLEISAQKLKEISVVLPPTLAEQKAIAAVLSDVDAEIAALEADRTKYERIKSGMMQELLTGRTRLKGE